MKIEEKIKCFKSDSLSKYKTLHHFKNYGEINSLNDYILYIEWAQQNRKDIYILGNGSNTLFKNRVIKSLILKNNMPKEIKCISEENNLYEISSNVMMNEILNYCYKKSLDSFYYLASVPATLGGALAMNAGEGMHLNKTIYDFVESVTYINKDNVIKEISRKDMKIEYRKTMFTGCQEKFIISAIFKFPNIDLSGIKPIKDRILWSKEHQDNVSPNCGSVFKMYNSRILKLIKGFKIGKSQYSSKTQNWINNKSSSSITIILLINITKFLHFIFRKKCKIEVILVK